MDFAATGARTGGDVLWAELAVETGLEGGDFCGSVGGYSGAVVEEWVGGCGRVFILVAGSASDCQYITYLELLS